MAIKNASDLLVYKKSPANVAQVTRIIIESGFSSANSQFGLFNTYNSSGNANSSILVNSPSTTIATVLGFIKAKLESNGYTTGNVTDGTTIGLPSGSSFFDATNSFVGDLPETDISLGWQNSTQEDTYGDIVDFSKFSTVVITSGETSNNYEPIAHSTSASVSFNMDLRDVTTKDSGGYQNNLGGLKSFELSSDALQDINADLDFKEFYDDINERNEVIVRFAERATGGTDVKWEGSGYISSLSMDAGVEENVTYSVTITGTSSVVKGTY